MIGDLLITFGVEAENCKARSVQPWSLVETFGALRLYRTLPGDRWHGFPLVEAEDEQWHVWLLGELYEETSILTQAVMNPEKLNGHFLLFGYEKSLKRMHVVTNRLGTVHGYYAMNGGKATIGTFSPAVAQASGKSNLNLQAISEFFSFGFFIGNSTHWQDVTILPAATHMILDENGRIFSQTPYWHWDYQPSASLTYDEAIKQFHDIFREVLTSQVNGKRIVLPLSGGLDSRSTLAELGETGFGGAKQMFPFSYGFSENSAETKIARQLGSRRGLNVKTWTVQPYLFDEIERISASVEGFQDITQCRQAYVVDELSQEADYVVAAHWGDVWLDDMGFSDQKMLSDETLTQIIINNYAKKGSEILLTLFAPNLDPEWKGLMKKNVQESLAGLQQIKDLDFKVKAWKTSQWSFRWTLSSLRMYQSGLFPLLPFYDNRLVDFFLKVPGEFVARRRLQIEYLKRYAPDLARVKWQPYDANLYHYKGFNTWLLPYRAVQKLRRRFSTQSVIQRNWEIQFLNPKGRNSLAKYLLEPGLKLQNLFSARDLEQFLGGFYRDPTASSGYAVSMLLTLSAWLEQYG